MQLRKRDLIVPIRDRRSRKRYLTLRNARNVTLVLAVVFIGITIRSEMQSPAPDSFGRLLERGMPAAQPKPAEVVKEAPPPIDDHTVPDPMLVAPMAREQWLHGDSTATTSASIEPIGTPVNLAPNAGDSRVTIVGGPEGVRLERQQRRRQVLRGGFGR